MSIKYRRDNGKEPFREDVDELVGQCLSGQIVDDVTEEEISAAFDRGDEVYYRQWLTTISQLDLTDKLTWIRKSG